jgi:hypothetical protein
VSTKLSNPVFIVGFLRSGTSLLYSLVNQHPLVSLMYECNAWDFPDGFGAARFRGNWLERLEFYCRTLSRHRLMLGQSLRGLEQVQTPDDLYRCFSQAKDAKLWGEKSPMYCTQLAPLARRYPNASFILIWRDPVEIYRSVTSAGKKARFFRRRAMMYRLIYGHEQMIRQAAELERNGARIHHVTYAALVDQPEQVCRGICQFLNLEFDPKMLDLVHADFSALDHAPHHEHLRRGVIKRREFKGEHLPLVAVAKLQRFRARWDRLTQVWTGRQIPAPAAPEPSLLERLYHRLTGAVLFKLHNIKRLLFEFLPLPWLRTYRQSKAWLLMKTPAAAKPGSSLRQCFAEHWATILASFAMLGLIGLAHHFSNPHILFVPFYLIPCTVLTLVLDRRWGIAAAAVACVIGPMVQFFGDSDYAHPSVLLWNAAMRFLLYAVAVILLDRVRVEIRSAQEWSG